LERKGALEKKSDQLLEQDGNRCFVCGPGNPIGLKLRFRMDADVCRSEFTPGPEHAGYDNVTHGGIIFSVLDDVMANWLWLKRIKCFTARADIRYRGHLPVGCAVDLEGRMIRRKGRLALMEGLVIRRDTGETVAQASGSFMVAE
jgi:acyl-coenzyme A thioesterase PaaI-like protein